ncbi:MAG: tandem-95 repeat protein, partial [Bacteroidales bacterium]|nr:tandem-95 repeat protein [Bacteroidales bacterium]
NTTDAADDAYATTKDVAITRNVSVNDYDAEGDNQNSFTVVSGPGDGSLTAFNAVTGTFTYTPDNGYSGPDQFVYVVCDDGIPTACDTATVYLMILPQGPIAINDINATTINTPVDGDVTPNDFDLDGDHLTVSTTPLLPPLMGNVVLAADGSYTYTPNNGYTGRDLFVYEVCDEDNLCDTAMVFITIVDNDTTGNNPPVANADHYEGVENTPINGQMLPNDYDPDGDVLTGLDTIAGFGLDHGTLSFLPDGSFTYTPDAGYTGLDFYLYEICDPFGLCDTTMVTVRIEPSWVGNTTDAVDDAYLTFEETPVSGNVSDNDYDAEGDPQITYTLVSGPSNGSLSSFNTSTGTFTYNPAAGYNGPDQFVYIVCDYNYY